MRENPPSFVPTTHHVVGTGNSFTNESYATAGASSNAVEKGS